MPSIKRVASSSISKGLTCAAIGLLVANCSQGPQRVSQRGSEYFPEGSKYGKASPRVVAEGEVVPKGGGHYQVGNAYSVAGRTYVPREMNRNYSAVGLASWYGSAFHGRRTANGEVYDKLSFTAAHPTMPLPSYARVTNLLNGRSMIVRVNDRGPFHGGRVMDVSERVADALDFKRIGTARIKVEHMAPAGLAGSDDRKLLASLRIDGQPATLPGLQQQEVQVASLEPAFTSIPQRGASSPVSRAQSPALVSRSGDSTDEAQQAYQADAGQPDEAAPQALSAAPAITAKLAESRPLVPARGIPLPPERPFSIGLSQSASLSASPLAHGQAGIVSVRPTQIASSVARTQVAIAPVEGYRSSKGLGYAPAKVSYFAPASDVGSQFERNDPFRSLADARFVSPSAKPVASAAPGMTVAIGVFRSEANARRIVAAMAADGAGIETMTTAGGLAYRVTAGPFAGSEAAMQAVARAKDAGAADARILVR